MPLAIWGKKKEYNELMKHLEVPAKGGRCHVQQAADHQLIQQTSLPFPDFNVVCVCSGSASD